MRKVVLLFISTAVSVVIYAQSAKIKLYVETYKEIAINEEIRSGVPAAITLAQGILESQCGQSELCQKSNNHFGVKCKENWTGPTTTHDDDVKGECFRVYGSAAESYKDHSDFLKYRPYYVDLFKLRQDDYKGWAYGLKKAGYATERDYPQNLIRLIEAYGLQQYTLVALERMKNPQPDVKDDIAQNNTSVPAATMPANTSIAVNAPSGPAVAPVVTVAKDDTEDEEEKDSIQPEDNTVVNTDAYPDEVFTINGTKVVYAKEGTSLFALANKHGIAYKTLLDFNELAKADILEKGMLIYLERKPKRGNKDYHVVTASETIEDIAQKEGVRLESLLQYNALPKGNQPVAGSKIYLRVGTGVTTKSRKA